MEKDFSTLDSYLGGFLLLSGHQPRLVSQRGRVVFVFAASAALSDAIEKYYQGATVPAAMFAGCIKSLRGRIHEMKTENGMDHGNSRPWR